MAEGIVWDDEAPITPEGSLRAPGVVWDDEPAPAQPSDKPGALSTLLHTGEQGFFKGHSDELIGGITRLAQEPGHGWKQPDGSVKFMATPGDVYDAARDDERRLLKQMHKERPVLSFLGQVGGDIASDIALAAAGAPGPGSLPYQMLSGAVSGAGNTDAEGAAPALANAGLGAGLSALGHGLGKYAIAPLVSKLGDKLSSRIAAAVADENAAVQALRDEAVDSASGQLGGNSGAVLHLVEKARKALEDPHATAELRAKAEAILADPKIIRTAQRAYENVFSRGGRKVTDMLGSERALEEAMQAAAPQSVQAEAAERLAHPLRDQIWPRVRKQVIDRGVVPAVGGLLGGAPGAVAAGLAAGAVGGRPSSAMEKMLNSPPVRKFGLELVKKALVDAPQLLGKYAAPLLRASTGDVGDLAATWFVLNEQDPEARKTFAELEQQQSP